MKVSNAKKPGKKRSEQSRAGFGLLEVLVVGLIASILMAGFLSMFCKQLTASRHLQSKVDLAEFKRTLDLILGDPISCPQALRKSNEPGPPRFDPDDTSIPATELLTNIKLGSTQIAGPNVVRDTYKVDSLSIDEVDPSLRTTTSFSVKYLAELTIKLSKTGTYLLASTSEYKVLLWLTVEPSTHVVKGCSSHSGSLPNTGGMQGHLVGLREFTVGATTDLNLNPPTGGPAVTADIESFTYTPKGRFLKIQSGGYMRITGEDTEGQIQMKIENTSVAPVVATLPWKLLFAEWGTTSAEATFGKLNDVTLVQVEPNQVHTFSFRLKAMNDFLSSDPPVGNTQVRFHKEYPLIVLIEDWE